MNEYSTVDLTLDDGSVLTCDILTFLEAEGKQYIVLLPLDENGEPLVSEDGENVEFYIYRYSETDGEPALENIDDDDEFDMVLDLFDEWQDTQEWEESDSE